MPIPSEQKLSAILKNNISEVVRFLESLHPNHYRIYNLCLEGKYEYDKFKGRVSEYQFSHTGAPTLALIVNFVNDAADWLDHHPRNVCVVHCSNGKSRTGSMVACLLLRTGVCSTPSEALQLFANRRTTDGKVVVKHPSQLRYVALYDQFRLGSLRFDDKCESGDIDILNIDGRGIGDARIEKNIPRIITGIRLSSAPQFRRRGGCDPWFSIDQKGKRIFFSPPMKGVKSTESVYFSGLRIIVAGDMRLDFYHKNFKTKMFSCSLHTAAFKVSAISLPKRELDLAWKDKGNKHFPPNFKLEIFLAAANDFIEDSTDASGERTSANIGVPHTNTGRDEENFEGQDKAPTSITTTAPVRTSTSTSTNSTLTGALTRMRASAQLETVSAIGTRCARCREVLGEQDFYLEVSGVSIHWDCLQCNECGRVFGEASGGARDSCVLMREGGRTAGCVHCGDFRNFFPACARCGEPVTAEEDCCVSVPAATTYWHAACFSCVRCAASLQFSDEDALWRIEPSTGMPICFYHPTLSDSSPVTSSPVTSSQMTYSSVPSPPPPSPSSGFFGSPFDDASQYPTNPDYKTLPEPIHANHERKVRHHNSDAHNILPQSQLPQSRQHKSAYQASRHTVSHTPGPQPLQLQQSPSNSHPSLPYQPNPHASKASQPSQSAHPQTHSPTHSPTHLHPQTHPQTHIQTNPQTHPQTHPQHPQTQQLNHTAPQATRVARHCNGCGRDVAEGEDVLSVGEGIWHPGCLHCAHCKVLLTPSHRVTAAGGKLYCRADFEALFGVLCGRCRLAINPCKAYVNVGTVQYHVQCCACTVCEKPLSAGTFFVRSDALLCEQHKNSPISQQPPATSSPHGDSGDAICHSVAALITTAKDVLVALDNFDKKAFVVLAKQLAAVGREYASYVDTEVDSAMLVQFNKSHLDLVQFCFAQIRQESLCPRQLVLPTCASLEASRTFLLQLK